MKQFSIGLALVFTTTIAVLAVLGYLTIFFLLFLIGISVVTYVVYWWDKSAARKNRWRVPENNLHFLAILGGWPGALIAQQVLRHKTQKQSFRLVFWLSVVVNLAVFIWLLVQVF